MFKLAAIKNEETGIIEVNFVMKLPEKYQSRFDDFFSLYEIITYQPNNLEQRILKMPRERVCRFCIKSHGEVTFRKKAHIIPELLGRSNYVSDFECDDCNQHFSGFETDLAAFIGISRSLSKKKGKEGIPAFKSADKHLEIRGAPDPDSGTRIQISSSDFENDIIINEVKKTVTIVAEHQTYTPLRIFKALVKLALSLLPEDEYIKYKGLTKMLLNKTSAKDPLEGCPLCRVMIHLNPGAEFPSPLAFVCQKKDAKSEIPTHTIMLYFNNYIYQFFLPFCEDDQWLYDGKTNITLYSAPPFVDQAFVDRFGEPVFRTVDLSSSERKKNIPENIVISYNSITKYPGQSGGQTVAPSTGPL